MTFTSSSFFVLILLITLGNTTIERQYECGAHGRFEYCINGLAGCVIGCHCHPGYYFDTDSKICEPNIKLTQDFRRHYVPQMTVVDTPVNTPATTKANPTHTPATELDKKVDEIAKDPDELSDWLYNQFFKTIETQVINKTSDNPKLLNRRSGDGGPPKKHKRKSSKSLKESKKKKSKVHGLRRKLLRITEDDSLFNSDSTSSGSHSGSSSSESDSGDNTFESDSKNGKDDKEHGHKKIIIFNKKPKSPLPSFIFLPHMDTPYYPPIGLPPPPIMPMYPMIPLPPIAPPMFPYPGSPVPGDCNTSTTTGVTMPATTEAHVESLSTTVIVNTVTADENSVPSSTSVSEDGGAGGGEGEGVPGGRSRLHMQQRKKILKGKGHTNEPEAKKLNVKFKGPRNKLMKKWREKMERQKAFNQLMEQEQDEDAPFLNHLPSSQEAYAYAKKMQMNAMDAGYPNLKDVDFKYLSELIHRANLNNTMKTPPHSTKQNDNINEMINTGQLSRRSYLNYQGPSFVPRATNFIPPRKLETSGTDNAFYTNLGRQIASLIRNIDSKGERQVNIEIERTNPLPMTHTNLNKNKFAPRSYWERSVRSPLQYFKEDFEYLNPSKDKLFSLESEVENAASTSQPLSLLELENILNRLSKSQLPLKGTVAYQNHEPSSASLNIDLLPRNVINDDKFLPFLMASKISNFEKTMNHFKPNELNATKDIEESKQNKIYSNDVHNASNLWLLNLINPLIEPAINKSIGITNVENINKPTRQSLLDGFTTITPEILPKRQRVEYLTFLHTVPEHWRLRRTTTKAPDLKYSQVQYKSLSYFPSSNYEYSRKQVPKSYPHSITTYSRGVNKPIHNVQRPSYFHHEFQYFDYFE